ncbi:N-acetylglucosaminyl-phosphatidylinositol de-N-acetylase [Cimex lectularius]|uniref:N-acetylglucosaminylphosphatidylinositol deacetylase n=1 Tax=Cimex lectularius TaxID=79782 RepID=A0A8I6SC75_CIMLE|nr:N-acetylglucosaminyl-phosphatidylinositol de-N-acetylase [Cimex lectularius]
MDLFTDIWGIVIGWLESTFTTWAGISFSSIFGQVPQHYLFLIYHFLLLVMIAIATSMFIAFIWQNKMKGMSKDLNRLRRVLLVTAHPDDECMFFGPTVLQLLKTSNLYLVCLSSGDYYGEGHVRREELWASCATLGINPNNIQLYHHDALLDDPIGEWNDILIANIILSQIETLAIDMVISFDGSGVSGHKNHISIYKGLEYLRTNNMLPNDCECYALNTVSILRKFFGVMNILFDISFSSYVLTCSYKEQQIIKLAMSKHASQYIWFRKVFMFFSRYTYINSFTRTS